MEDVFACSSCNAKFINSATKIGYQKKSGWGWVRGWGISFFK